MVREWMAAVRACVMVLLIVTVWPMIWVGDRACGVRPYAQMRRMIRQAWRSR
jgi:hypothetical protein